MSADRDPTIFWSAAAMVRESNDPSKPAAPVASLPDGGQPSRDVLSLETVEYAENLTRPGFLVFDGQGKLHCANLEAYRIFGREAGDAELVQRDGFFRALGCLTDDGARVEAQCAAAAAGGFGRFFTVNLTDGRQLGVSTDQLCNTDGGEPGAAWIVSELADKTWRTVDSRVIGPITRAAMAATPDGMMIADTEGKVIAINQTFASMWDIEQDEFVGRPRTEFLGRFARKLRDPEAFIQQTLEYHRDPRSHGGGIFEMLDGRFLERYTAPLLTRGGEILGRIVFYRDVTQHMQTASKLATSAAQLHNALAQARVAPWEYDFTTDTFALNDMFYALHKRTADEVGGYTIGRARFVELFVHPDYADVPAKVLGAAVAERDRMEFVPFEHPVIDGDGSTSIVAVRGTIFRDEDGNALRAVGIAQDVTARRALDAQIAERQHLNELLVEQKICGICIMNADGRVTFANSRIAEMLEVPLEEVIGRPAMEFVPPEELPALHRALHAQIRGRRPFVQVETTVNTRGGRPVDILVTSSAFIHEGKPASLIFLFDITELRTTARRLEQVNHTRRIISACNSVLIRATSEEELLRDMCRVAVEEGTLAMAWIGYKEHDPEKSVRPVAHAGVGADYVAGLNVSWDGDNPRGRGPSGTSIRVGRTQVSQDFQNDPRVAPWRAAARNWGFNSSICLPLKQGDETFGAFTIYSRRRGDFMPDEVAMLEEMAGNLAFGITTHRTRLAHERDTRHLHDVMVQTIGALGAMIEQRDPYTAGHQRNVARLAAAIARDMGLDAHRVQGIELGALVHDIGKIRVPAEILTKPGKLTDLEFQIIKMHPEVGREIVQGIDFPWPIGDMVAQHHERLDGTGYPAGLKGDQIPLESRILAVADVVEAITARRPYRAALGIDAALDEISAKQGTHFDGAVVAACVRVFKEQNFSFE